MLLGSILGSFEIFCAFWSEVKPFGVFAGASILGDYHFLPFAPLFDLLETNLPFGTMKFGSLFLSL